MVAAVLVAVVGLGALIFALGALRNAEGLVPPIADVRAALRDGDGMRVRDAMRALLPNPEDADVVAHALAGETLRAVGIATLNEHLGDVGRSLTRGRALSRMLPRLSLGAGLFGAVVALTLREPGETGAWLGPLASALVGGFFAAATFEASRRVESAETRARAGWDDVARALAVRLEAGGPEDGESGPRSGA